MSTSMLGMRYILTVMLLLTVSTAKAIASSLLVPLWHKEVVMGYSNGTITAPVSASDPYAVLGVGKYNDGYDWGYICSNRHGKTNMWSKFKPVRYSKPDDLSFEDRKYKGFGFEIMPPQEDAIRANAQKYAYLAPRGGQFNEWFRITDWIGYNHYARPPLDMNSSHFPDYWDFDETDTVTVEMLGNWDASEMEFSDFGSLGEYYPAICVIDRNNPQNYQWKTGLERFKEHGMLPIGLFSYESMFLSDYVEYFIVAARDYKETFEEEKSTAFLPIPSLEGQTFHINVYNWQAKAPTVNLYKIVWNGNEHNYEAPPSSISVGSVRDFKLGFIWEITNNNDQPLYIEPESIMIHARESNGRFEAWFYSSYLDTATIDPGETWTWQMEFDNTYTISDYEGYYDIAATFYYNDNNLWDNSFNVYGGY